MRRQPASAVDNKYTDVNNGQPQWRRNRSINRGPELLGAPEFGANKILRKTRMYATSEKLTSEYQETIKCVNEAL